ncbi:MAG: hypothetical protein DHS20C09_21080 [marine bacterium B5-7]|nr:MAG: hypothetical protein DHS20C09_21080 [marine bacterium B5-7]
MPTTAANYVLTIDGQSYDISLDTQISVKVGEQNVAAKLVQKDFLTFATENFSFEHPKQFIPAKSNLGDGLFQTVLMTPVGSAVMVQEYLNMAPSSLMDLMINEITKEEREYGYQIESNPVSKTLPGGKVLDGMVVTSKYKGSDMKRVFYTYSVKDSGLFIMTQIDYEIGLDDEEIIDNIIDSLKITMQ